MKKLGQLIFLSLLLIASNSVLGQNVFTINKLYKQDTLVNGWIFQPGDNPGWASPDFDDIHWKPLDPGIDITQFDQLKKSGVGWLRVHIKADTNLIRQGLSAAVIQYSASEIYLNGKLIQKYGIIGKNLAKNSAYNPGKDPFTLKLRQGMEDVIAVRVAYQSGIIYSSPDFNPLPVFTLYINSTKNALANQQQAVYLPRLLQLIISVFAGIFAILSLIHFVNFIFDHKLKVNLYYALYSLACLIFCIWAAAFYYETVNNIATQMWATFIALGLGFASTSLFLVLTIYALFSYKSRTGFKILVCISIVLSCYAMFNDILGFAFSSNGIMALCVLEGVRVSIWAIKNKKKDAVILLCGLVISFIMIVWSTFLDQSTMLALVMGLLSIFGLPLCMSIYLGIQNGATNRQLRNTLLEVQTLSEQNSIMQKEKQAILSSQNATLEMEVNNRTAELNLSLNTLKSTQAQLIQSEKMASLGELTAGIAHEIQNPLNFVNNFSEVSIELLEELKAESEKQKAERDDELESELIIDLTQNLEKINHHGKRADNIVKGMLEHSRARSGQKELTDINQLADEYLRLSYHGLRAKDKNFNAELTTYFDETLPKIEVVPQDIGRVFLNLFNNAFYAVNEKKKIAGADFRPEVSVTTATENGQLIIRVKDNGNGIPDAIKDKIMQPFFTTKPTGEGTGLGLSLSYDIVVKGHGGSISVETKEGEFTQFTVTIPIS